MWLCWKQRCVTWGFLYLRLTFSSIYAKLNKQSPGHLSYSPFVNYVHIRVHSVIIAEINLTRVDRHDYVLKCQVKVCWLSSVLVCTCNLCNWCKSPHWRVFNMRQAPFTGSMMIILPAIFCMSDSTWEQCHVSHPTSCFRMPPLEAGQTVSVGGTKHWWQAPGKAAVEVGKRSLHGDWRAPQTCTHTRSKPHVHIKVPIHIHFIALCNLMPMIIFYCCRRKQCAWFMVYL